MELQRQVQCGRDEAVHAARWFKSSHSTPDGNCVEVAMLGDGVGLRDSKDRSSAVLTFTPGEWSAFVRGVRDGEFDM